MARATSAASAMASTTVAGPRRQSPAAQTPSTPVEVAARRPRRSCSTPAASYRLASMPLAHGADHRGGGKLDGLARGDGAATAACIRLAKLHNIAGQHGAVECLGRQQLAELNAVGKSKIKLFPRRRASASWCGDTPGARSFTPARRLATRAASMAVLPAPMTTTSSPSSELLALLGGLEELQHVELGTLAQARRAGHPGTGGHDHVGKALGLELSMESTRALSCTWRQRPGRARHRGRYRRSQYGTRGSRGGPRRRANRGPQR